jgi:hypothetical protein
MRKKSGVWLGGSGGGLGMKSSRLCLIDDLRCELENEPSRQTRSDQQSEILNPRSSSQSPLQGQSGTQYAVNTAAFGMPMAQTGIAGGKSATMTIRSLTDNCSDACR